MVKFTARFTDSLGRKWSRQIKAVHSGQAQVIAGKLGAKYGWKVVGVGRI